MGDDFKSWSFKSWHHSSLVRQTGLRKVLESTFQSNPGLVKPRGNLSVPEMVSWMNFTYVRERFLVDSVLHSLSHTFFS